MKYYTLVLETENVFAKFPYTDKEFAKRRFEETLKSNKFVKVELIVEGEEEVKEERVEVKPINPTINLKKILEELRAETKEEARDVEEFEILF